MKRDRDFGPMLAAQYAKDNYGCLGLDSDYDVLPALLREARGSIEAAIDDFNCANIDATSDIVCAYKFDIAFYRKHGDAGSRALRESVAYIRNGSARDAIIIGDTKYCGSELASPAQAHEAFEWFGFDAITLCHLPGRDANRSFLQRKDKGIFVLCHMSHEGATEFQDDIVQVETPYDSTTMSYYMPAYQRVAQRVADHWNQNGNCGLVMGVTYPEQLKVARKTAGDIPMLLTGLYSQGGRVETVKYGVNSQRQGIIANISRSATFADTGVRFADMTRAKMLAFRGELNKNR